jgi:hypothetical protein
MIFRAKPRGGPPSSHAHGSIMTPQSKHEFGDLPAKVPPKEAFVRVLPARVRSQFLVLDDSKETNLSWHEIIRRFLQRSVDPAVDLMKLRNLRAGAFLGVTRSIRNPEKTSIFIVIPPAHKWRADLAPILQLEPDFCERVLDVLRVVEVSFGGAFTEATAGLSQP